MTLRIAYLPLLTLGTQNLQFFHWSMFLIHQPSPPPTFLLLNRIPIYWGSTPLSCNPMSKVCCPTKGQFGQWSHWSLQGMVPKWSFRLIGEELLLGMFCLSYSSFHHYAWIDSKEALQHTLEEGKAKRIPRKNGAKTLWWNQSWDLLEFCLWNNTLLLLYIYIIFN